MKNHNITLVTGLFIGLLAQPANAAYLHKILIAEQVDPAAQILGGARIQTWAGDNLINANVTLFNTKPPIRRGFTHATNNTGRDTINGGLPVRNTGQTAAQGWAANLIIINDGHDNPNIAEANTSVNPLQAMLVPISWLNPATGLTELITPMNAVEVFLQTTAEAGLPVDGDAFHSADAFAGIEIQAGRIFKFQDAAPFWTLYGQNQMFTEANSGSTQGNIANAPQVQDPYYVTVNDLDTGESTTQEVMLQEAEARNGTVLLDNSGLLLTINKNNPNAFAELRFNTDSSWVVDPYDYTVTLDQDGLSLLGIGDVRFPLQNWQITTTDETIEAFYSFGANGLPFDRIEVLPPESLFTDGHNYSYDAGSGGGVFEVARATKVVRTTPEPSSVASLFAFLGFLGCFSFLRQSKKMPIVVEQPDKI